MIGSTNAINKINEKYEQLVNYTMLYDYGDECTDITGGWIGGTYSTNAKFTKYNNYLYLHSYRTTATMNNKLDLTKYDKIFANTYTLGRIEQGYSAQSFNVATSKTFTQGRLDNIVIRTGHFNVNYPTAGEYIFDFDIVSEAKGEYYLGIQMDDDKNNGYLNLYHMALIKNDDWQTLANIAGITAVSIDDILTNSATLLSNENAVEFMIKQCTGSFMTSAIQSSTFLTALNNSAYKTIIMANEHWAKFLNMVA